MENAARVAALTIFLTEKMVNYNRVVLFKPAVRTGRRAGRVRFKDTPERRENCNRNEWKPN